MEGTIYSTGELLQIIEGLELRMRDFYARLAEKFNEPEDVRIFWSTLSQQESVHATIIHTLYNMYRNNPHMFSDSFEIDAPTIKKMNEFIRDSERKLESEDFTLDTALNEAFDLETLFELNAIYDKIIGSPTAPFHAIIDDLVESEDVHLNALLRAVKKHATDEKLIKRAESFYFSLRLSEPTDN